MQDWAAFTGLKMGTLTTLLRDNPLPLRRTVGEGKSYWHLGGWSRRHEVPPCLFLSGFDQLLLAYRDRSRLLDAKNQRDVITSTGIIHPTIILDGRIRAKWKKDGRTLRVTPFVEMQARTRRLVEDGAHALFGEDIDAVAFAGKSA